MAHFHTSRINSLDKKEVLSKMLSDKRKSDKILEEILTTINTGQYGLYSYNDSDRKLMIIRINTYYFTADVIEITKKQLECFGWTCTINSESHDNVNMRQLHIRMEI